ncbi:LacI family DNA-binding transcriptional regulator [Ktedonospora formicarum]|uniref:LacI family transcriptional regulator n=1 Tax=Ktedonospora formicarum TaxID=2778364 RepID=A0A8J3MTV6_9CHLR|nr:LacI family DNA-binding transcriptional regulator [Ktedonospora formicarum]GHO46003.1 LacI family transcriptional regulator [Ktedonospora formicarum]
MAKASEKHRVTSADVARACGVSRATVSYVLNNDPRQTIPPETRERILQAAQKLGYSPFAPARLLRSGQSQLVLAVLPFEQVDPALARSLKELEQRLARHDLTLLSYVGMHPSIGTTHPSAHITPSVLLSYADQDDPLVAAFLQQFHAPILHLLGDARLEEQIGAMQAEYLIQCGKRSLIFLDSERKDVQRLSSHRFRGVQQACLRWECTEPVLRTLPSSREEARTILRDTLASCDHSWGICCYNDEVAIAALAALADENITIPHMAAVVGCDNIPLAQWSLPALTTIAFHNESALDPLIEAIVALSRGETVTWKTQKTLTLIKRASA